MKTKLITIIQGREESFESYAVRLEAHINAFQFVTPIAPILHQTAAQDGRINTMIQFTIKEEKKVNYYSSLTPPNI